jgi:hypothetical protein
MEKEGLFNVSISYIDQSKCELLGYQAFYKSGKNKFYKRFEDIENNIISDPLINIKQVGRFLSKS